MDSTSENSKTQCQIIDITTHAFKIPSKQVNKPDDLTTWENSQAYSDLVGFILTLNKSIQNKKTSDDYPISNTVDNLLELLITLEKWLEEIPPIDQPQRFGNKAFRTWFDKLKENAETLLTNCLPQNFNTCVPEISIYLIESVGNSTRIDYGTGHELSFVAFLCCLCKIGALVEDDYPAIVLKVFDRYLNLMRLVQHTYRMEPAGSHGVWSLDDYQFLPFLWGSSQLLDHERIKPKSFPDPDIFNTFYKDYLFLGAIKFINQMKTGPFAEHSNQLWGISGVPTWLKVNTGLIKMYRVEVLGKYVIIQHFLFGSLLTLEKTENPLPAVSAPNSSTSLGSLGSRPGIDTIPPMGMMPRPGMMPPMMGVMPRPTGANNMPPMGAMPRPTGTDNMPPMGMMPRPNVSSGPRQTLPEDQKQ